MSVKTAVVIIIGGVVVIEGIAHLTRKYLRRNRRFKRFQRLLDGGNSLLRTPQGYEELHLSAKQAEESIRGLKLGPRIGYGSSGMVFNGLWEGARVAVKVLYHESKDSYRSATIAREAVIGAAMSHPNIVHVFLVSTKRLVSAYKEGLETWIIMEYCDLGTLFDQHTYVWKRLVEDSSAGLRWILRCLIDIAGALQYMHSLGLVHGDLKSNNILLQSSSSEARGFRCKVADMGCSRLLSTAHEAVMKGVVRVTAYDAPEVLKEGSLSQASDIYSFAVIIWHLLSHGDDFFMMSEARLYTDIVESEIRPAFPGRTNSELKGLAERCWDPIPARRPSSGAILAQLTTLYDQSL